MKVKLIKFKDDVQFPQRKHYNDAGADIYNPELIIIKPLETVKIPLGFGLELPDNMMGCVYPRSSLAAKGLVSHIPPIDSGYRGEIHAIMANLSNEDITLCSNERIAQLIITPVYICDFIEKLGEERNEGAFGSTGMK